MKKKLILLIVVFVEIVASFYISKIVYKKYTDNEKVLGVSSVSKIDKRNAIISQNSELKHYLQLGEGEWEEQPDWLGQKVTYHINSDGLREFKEYQPQKPENTFRIIALGDSFTYAQNLNAEDGWTKQLEAKLNNENLDCDKTDFEVINLGMPGYDVQYIVQRYKDLGEKYDPDLILWFESGYSFLRQNELTAGLVDECMRLDPEDNKKEFDYEKIKRCNHESYIQLYKNYSQQDLLKIKTDYLDDFFKINENKKVIYFYYNNLPKEKLKILDVWKERYQSTKFLPLIPERNLNEVLQDGHPNYLGQKSIADNIYQYISDNKTCQ